MSANARTSLSSDPFPDAHHDHPGGHAPENRPSPPRSLLPPDRAGRAVDEPELGARAVVCQTVATVPDAWSTAGNPCIRPAEPGRPARPAGAGVEPDEPALPGRDHRDLVARHPDRPARPVRASPAVSVSHRTFPVRRSSATKPASVLSRTVSPRTSPRRLDVPDLRLPPHPSVVERDRADPVVADHDHVTPVREQRRPPVGQRARPARRDDARLGRRLAPRPERGVAAFAAASCVARSARRRSPPWPRRRRRAPRRSGASRRDRGAGGAAEPGCRRAGVLPEGHRDPPMRKRASNAAPAAPPTSPAVRSARLMTTGSTAPRTPSTNPMQGSDRPSSASRVGVERVGIPEDARCGPTSRRGRPSRNAPRTGSCGPPGR